MELRTNLKELARDLDDVVKEQLPYALALTLTRVAMEARDHLQGNLKIHFTVRSRWVVKSIQMDKANKRDPDPTAVVGSLYDPMALHAEGGTKRPKRGMTAVPFAARPSKKAKTTLKKFPRALLERKRFFSAPVQNQPDAIGIWQRTSQRRYPIKLWWILKPEVEIKPDWPFEDEVVAVANRELHDNFWASLEEAWSKRKR